MKARWFMVVLLARFFSHWDRHTFPLKLGFAAFQQGKICRLYISESLESPGIAPALGWNLQYYSTISFGVAFKSGMEPFFKISGAFELSWKFSESELLSESDVFESIPTQSELDFRCWTTYSFPPQYYVSFEIATWILGLWKSPNPHDKELLFVRKKDSNPAGQQCKPTENQRSAGRRK